MHGGAASRQGKRNGSVLTEHARIPLSVVSGFCCFFFFSQNSEVCTCVKPGCGDRAHTPAHGASSCWSSRFTCHPESEKQTQNPSWEFKHGKGEVIAWRDFLFEFQFSFTLGCVLSIYSHIKGQDQENPSQSSPQPHVQPPGSAVGSAAPTNSKVNVRTQCSPWTVYSNFPIPLHRKHLFRERGGWGNQKTGLCKRKCCI